MTEGGGSLLRIKETIDTLSPKEQQLAEFILATPQDAVNLSIEQLALAAKVSPSTVIRLCKSLSFGGYKSFSRSLYHDVVYIKNEEMFEDIHPGDEPETVMRTIALSSIQAIENTVSITDPKELIAAVDAMSAASRIHFYGMGTSGLVAMDAGNKFLRINKTVAAHTGQHTQILTALTLTSSDVAFLISYSGETIDLLNTTKEIKKTGATIISLTRFGKNTLAEMADIRLYSSSTETLLRSGAMSSRIAQLFVIDTLYAGVCSKSFEQLKGHLDKTRIATAKMHNPAAL